MTFRTKKTTGHRIKKSFGQNFLTDLLIKDRIISSCDLHEDDIVLEIGPGEGAITELIAPRVKKVIAIEADKDLIKPLQKKFAGTNVEIIFSDILTYNLTELPDNVKIISNLPYNIATPIIENVIQFKHKFTEFYMTVQLEYGQRLIAKPDTKSYGSLSCFIQYHSDIELLFKISNKAFTPQPKVQSCFLKMTLLHKPKQEIKDEKFLFGIIKSAFNQRRKTLSNALAPILDKDDLKKAILKLKIDPLKRAENISLIEYINLSNTLKT